MARLVQAIADRLRSRPVPRAAEHIGETYRGPIRTDGLRAADRTVGDSNASSTEQAKHAMDGTGRAGQRDAPLIVADELERIPCRVSAALLNTWVHSQS